MEYVPKTKLNKDKTAKAWKNGTIKELNNDKRFNDIFSKLDTIDFHRPVGCDDILLTFKNPQTII